MNISDNKAVYFKREALKKVVAAFDKGTLETKAYAIPFEAQGRAGNTADRNGYCL